MGREIAEMLSHLRIKDFAIIDDVDIQFGEGFSVITGETGAGKSILIEAITLLLGFRGDTDFIRNKSEELLVEGIFTLKDNELLIRRTLNTSGKSKIYINGRLSTLNNLKDTTSLLVDISGQHQHQMLLNEDFHIDIVDGYGENEALINEYQRLREEFLKTSEELRGLHNRIKEKDIRLDFLRFEKKELSDAAITRDEYEKLLQESHILRHGARFQQLLSETESIVYSQDQSLLDLLGRAKKKIGEISGISNEFEAYMRDFENFEIVISELNKLISERLMKMDLSSERLDIVEERLHRIKRICEKYNIGIEDILLRLKHIETEINELENSDIITQEIERRIIDLFSEIKKRAIKLHQIREKAASEISSRCEEILKYLGFKGARVKFELSFNPPTGIEESEKIMEKGFDRVKILFAPNVGEDFKPLSKIASGGELSRVMLAFKSAISGSDRVQTYIFDEVDAGIGGAVAESVGRFLKELSKKRQVICITHLPQIASLGDNHFTVEKIIQDKRTKMRIRKIKDEERVEEIARMLGGHKITEKNRAYARELLEKEI